MATFLAIFHITTLDRMIRIHLIIMKIITLLILVLLFSCSAKKDGTQVASSSGDKVSPTIQMSSGWPTNLTYYGRTLTIGGQVSDNQGILNLEFHKNSNCSDSALYPNSQELFNSGSLVINGDLLENLKTTNVYAKVTDISGNSLCKFLFTFNHVKGPVNQQSSTFNVEKTLAYPKIPAPSNKITFYAKDVNLNPISGLTPKINITVGSNVINATLVETQLGVYEYTALIDQDYYIELDETSIPNFYWQPIGSVRVVNESFCYDQNGFTWTNHKQSGTGTNQDPYKICSADQLKSLADSLIATDLAQSYKLMADIDLALLLTDESNAFSIGSQGTPFTGIFDGNNLAIKKFKMINQKGLFYDIKGGEVKNLTVSIQPVSLSNGTKLGPFINQIDSTISGVIISNIKLDADIVNVGVDSSTVVGIIGSITSNSNNIEISKISFNNKLTNFNNGVIGGLIGEAISSGSNLIISEISGTTTFQSYSNSLIGGGLIGKSIGIQLNNSKIMVQNSGSSMNTFGSLVGDVTNSDISKNIVLGSISGSDVNHYGGIAGNILGVNSNFNSNVINIQTSFNNCLSNCGRMIGGDIANINIFENNYSGLSAGFNFSNNTNINNYNLIIDDFTNSDYFYNATNAPYNNFDFTNIWESSVGNYPLLKFAK